MKYHLLTYDQAKSICDKTGDLIFYEKVQYVNDYKISVFNYRLANYMDFVDNSAYEMRGITFVFDKDGSLFKRYLLMNKFFNLNQVTETLYHNIKHIPIKEVRNKEDGSIITFVKLPDGSVHAKSKMELGNEYATMADNIYANNAEVKKLVDWSLDNDIVSIWELVGPSNRVVLKYKETNLILLRLRDNVTGEYLDLNDFDLKVDVAKSEPYKTWDELIALVETETDKEGWVVELVDNDNNVIFVKLKTTFYCDRHGLLTDLVYREDFIIRKTLEDEIDDVIAQLDEDEKELRDRIESISKKVHDYLITLKKDVLALWDVYVNEYNKDNKTFALAERKNPLFAYIMSLNKGVDIDEIVIKSVLKKTSKLESARAFLDKL